MVKLFALNVLYKGDNSSVFVLKSAYSLQSFGFFERGTVQEFMCLFSKTIVDKTQKGARQSIKQDSYMCHVYVRLDGLAGVVVSDIEYPHRVAHTLISRIMEDFAAKVPPDQWRSGQDESTIQFDQLPVFLAKYQNPKDADPLMRLQEDLDETKIILHNTIAAVLERGENLDTLVQKSEGLSLQSKAFYKTARKTNSCCPSL